MIYADTPCPKTTPWGKPDDVRRLAPGVHTVSTASHGGIHLSRERNAKVPQIARAEGGWYEEDSDWALAALAHPDAFTTKELASARGSAIAWNPDGFTAITGEPVATEDSHILRERAFEAANLDLFVAGSGFGDWAHWVPNGMVGVFARRASDGAEQWALTPAGAYTGRHYVLDPTRDTYINKPENYGRSKADR